jgi:hypothetical protein
VGDDHDAADAGDAAAGFDFGDAARMVAEFGPILGGAPAGQRGQKAARARTHTHAHGTHTHTRTRTRTRTRMHTLARMFARFCFHVSLFALLVLLDSCCRTY